MSKEKRNNETNFPLDISTFVFLADQLTRCKQPLISEPLNFSLKEAPYCFLTARDLGANIGRAMLKKHGGSIRSHDCYLKKV